MDLRPTRGEARLLVTCLFVFWTGGAVTTVAEVPAAIVVLLPFVFVAHLVPGRVVSRATGWPAIAVFNFGWPFGGSPEERAAREVYRQVVYSLNWWRTAIRETGWPVPLVTVALVSSFVAALAGVALVVGT